MPQFIGRHTIFHGFGRSAAESPPGVAGYTWWGSDRFTLPEGAIFHDGKPLTARDVAFSYRLYASTKDSVRSNELYGMESVRAIGERTGLRLDPAARVADLPVSAQQRCEIVKTSSAYQTCSGA